ncbi:outer membrane beta-barrel protein [Bacteroides sp.]|uniref:outer membrane beta-barrel protein n=1 Tax=Bacteroides sp. TaxID=29523 RepID=UPI002FCA08C4
MKRNITLLFMFIVYSAWTSAQNGRQSFAFHVGYGNMLEGTSGLTIRDNSYQDKLCKGVNWDAQYYVVPFKHLGFGLLYSGYSAQARHEEGADHVYTHFISPQAGLYIINNNAVDLRFNAGLGWMFYRNNGEVFSNSRTVTTSNLAGNLGLNFNYKLNSNWGIGADVQYLIAKFGQMDVRYHDETIKVTFPNGESLSGSRLSISAGITYSF